MTETGDRHAPVSVIAMGETRTLSTDATAIMTCHPCLEVDLLPMP
jgi:hypothetical protein